MKNKKNLIIGIVTVAVLLLSYFTYEHLVYVETDNAQIDAHTVIMSAKVGGFVQNVLVNEGQEVKKGDILVEIDDRDYRVNYDIAKSDLLSLEAKREDAEKNYQRIKNLSAKGVVSAQQYDTAIAAYHETKAKYDAASAHVEQAKLNLEYAKLIAPSDGIIAKKSVEIGQLVAPGVALVGFVGSEGRWIMANLKETQIENVRVNQDVDVKIDALSQKFKGKVESISSATGATFSLLPPDNATGNFTKVVQRVPVKIRLDSLSAEDIPLLQAGLSAVVKIKVR